MNSSTNDVLKKLAKPFAARAIIPDDASHLCKRGYESNNDECRRPRLTPNVGHWGRLGEICKGNASCTVPRPSIFTSNEIEIHI